MSRSSARGFTLVELLVAMTMLAVLGLGLVRLLAVVQRTSRTQSERSAMQGTLRTGLQLAVTELQELSPNPSATGGGTDITAVTASSITYRAMRAMSVTCEDPTSTTVKIRASGPTYSAYRAPQATRDVLLILEHDADPAVGDEWRTVAITAVAPGTCPDGDPAWTLTLANDPLVGAIAVFPATVRIYETMRLGLVTQDGRDWLGLESVSGGVAMTPLAGPVIPGGTGVQFAYRDDNNADAMGTPTAIRSIILTLRGQSDRPGNTGVGSTTALLTDSVVTRIQLRNSP